MNTITDTIYKLFLLPKLKKEISRLQSLNTPQSKTLVTVLRKTLTNKIFPEENLWIEKIETLRKQLNISQEKILIQDYGAQSPKKKLTQEEMYQGREISTTIGKISKNSSKPYTWASLLFHLIRNFKPTLCLELGTCVGISTLYQAAALHLNNNGKIITLEGAESLAKIAQRNIHQLGFSSLVESIVGRFQDTLLPTLQKNPPIDFAFIDGHHDGTATLQYFEQIFPFLSNNAILIFDDIHWSKGMNEVWKKIQNDKRIPLASDISQVGICFVEK